jgi:hypothetical protein
MACFHRNPAIVGTDGERHEGWDEIRRQYETAFAVMPDCRCDLRLFTGNSGRAVAESPFHGTRPLSGRVIEAVG